MKPTKTTWTKRTKAAKKPRKVKVKRAVDAKSPLGRLLKLKYRINDAYNHRQENDGETKSDKTWVMEQISDLRNGGWLSATKMKVANELWKKYPKSA
jgi:hypothetical protein|tara:strand:+ start:43 stop:333 length:291 start_codon:yes stop_codon:yes gene_type:complete